MNYEINFITCINTLALLFAMPTNHYLKSENVFPYVYCSVKAHTFEREDLSVGAYIWNSLVIINMALKWC